MYQENRRLGSSSVQRRLATAADYPQTLLTLLGVPLPFGVTTILREAARTPRTEEVALLGRNYIGAEAIGVGLAHEVLPEEGFEEACLERLGEYASRDPKAYGMTKRYLRSGAVERIRANDAMLIEQFLDCWFSDEALSPASWAAPLWGCSPCGS